MGTAIAKQEKAQVLPRRSSVTAKPVARSRNSTKSLSRKSSVKTKPAPEKETETSKRFGILTMHVYDPSKKFKLSTNGRTKLANSCGRAVNAIFHLTQNHQLPPSLKRRLENCASDLWDLEIGEDVKSGAYAKSEFGKMARRAHQAHKEGKTVPLSVALKALKERKR